MNNFTEAAKKVLEQAEYFALYSGNIIESIHILIGITKVVDGYGAQILSRLGFNTTNAESYLIKSSFASYDSVLVSPTVQKILDYAKSVAKATNSAIDTHHLLLAVSYHKSCVGSKILLKHNITYDKLLSIVESMNHNQIGVIEKKLSPETSFKSRINTEPKEINEKNDTTIGKKSEFKYGLNLIEMAKNNQLEKIIGREKEIARIISILSRKTKNNPIIVGESGVGKTAIVEKLAEKIASGNVPDFLKNKELYSLNLNSIVSGTKYRGDLEEKLSEVLDFAEKRKAILFIDELHSAVNVGNSEGGMNVSDILKPAITGKNIKIIGATTTSEYSKHIEKDPAFERRFMKVKVEEPTEDECLHMLKGIKKEFELHYDINIPETILKSCVALSARYITNKFLPDKAIDVLDETCSKNAVWNNKKSLSEDDVKEAVSSITGIPIYKLTIEESEQLLRLEDELNRKVIGQKEAISSIARAVRRSKAALKEPHRPIGSFIFLGSSGVGKTETAKILTEILFGNETNMFRFDMSEYMEKSSVAKLIGSAPGYVGYEEGGKLTESVKHTPYSLILFDEIEKAHPDIFNVLLQVLDDGRLTDSKGRTVDFKNTIIIMTSNAGSEQLNSRKGIGFGSSNQYETEKDIRIKALKNFLRPEFINRVDCITVFNNLNKENIKEIANNILNKKRNYLLNEKGIALSFDEEVIDFIANESFDPIYGARPVIRKIETLIEDKLSDMIIKDNLRNTELIVEMKDNNTVIREKIPGGS